MEQKKTLWIVAAAGVFLLVVAGAAILLSSQKNSSYQNNFNPSEGWVSSAKAPESSFAPEHPEPQPPVQNYAENSFDGVAPLSNEQPLNSQPAQTLPQTQASQPQQTTAQTSDAPAQIKAGNVTVIADNTLVYGTGTTTTIDLNALKSNPAPQTNVTPQNSYTATQMETNGASKSVSKNTASSEYKASSDSYYAPAAKKTVPKKEAVKTTVSSSRPKTAAKSTAKASAKPAAQPSKPASFWIQVGSYEAKKSADEARTILEDNKIQNEVFTYTNSKGKLFYRVRVGPYTTKSEAEYWKNRISALDTFAKSESYVVQN